MKVFLVILLVLALLAGVGYCASKTDSTAPDATVATELSETPVFSESSNEETEKAATSPKTTVTEPSRRIPTISGSNIDDLLVIMEELKLPHTISDVDKYGDGSMVYMPKDDQRITIEGGSFRYYIITNSKGQIASAEFYLERSSTKGWLNPIVREGILQNCATTPYDGATPKEAKAWVRDTLTTEILEFEGFWYDRGKKKEFGNASYSIAALSDGNAYMHIRALGFEDWLSKIGMS